MILWKLKNTYTHSATSSLLAGFFNTMASQIDTDPDIDPILAEATAQNTEKVA